MGTRPPLIKEKLSPILWCFKPIFDKTVQFIIGNYNTQIDIGERVRLARS